MAVESSFDKLAWKSGRMRLGDLVFEVDDRARARRGTSGESAFVLLKPKRVIDQYAKFWRLRSDFAPGHILELGIHEGGSLVFWFEIFRPHRLVALDVAPSRDSGPFRHYVASRHLHERITTYWGTSQADSSTLRHIVATDLGDQLDLVLDDASHLYPLSKASFETLFPLLRPGGLYVIEDWSWACWSDLPTDFNPSMRDLPEGMNRDELPLVRLICELAVATGKMEHFLLEVDGFYQLRPLIANVHVYPDFAVIERGEAEHRASDRFRLDRHLLHWPDRRPDENG